jgi:hypothetical protein
VVRQNYSYGNSNPDDAAEEAAKLLAKHIQSLELEDFALYAGGLLEARHQQDLIKELPVSLRSAGYNPWNREHLQDAWDELSIILPRKIRKSGLDKFIAWSDIKGEAFTFVEGSNPQNIWDHLAAKKATVAALEEADEIGNPFEEIEEVELDISWAAE